MKPLVLVTGGSRGIGAATCRLAARAGYDIALNYLSRSEEAERVAADCRAAGAAVELIQADTGSPEGVAALFAALDARVGRLDHLVNNAGIVGLASRLDDASVDTVRSTIDINVTGAILVAREAVRRLSRRNGGRGGSIVNLSSVAANIGAPGEFVWYAASKGAIDAFTIGLAKEVGGDGIRVNAVAPGIIDTDIHASAGKPERVAQFAPLIPMGRAGTAEEVAESILFLMSDRASYVSGAILRIGGGR